MPLIPAGDLEKQLAATLRERRRAMTPVSCLTGSGTADTPHGGANARSTDCRKLGESVPETRNGGQPATRFRDDPLSLDQIRGTLTSAYADQQAHWPPAAHHDLGLAMLLVAFRVATLSPNVYAAGPPGTGMFAAVPVSGLLTALRQHDDAPALLLICGDLDAACRASGESGYGSLLVRAGAMAHAAWLAAVGAGLAGHTCGRATRLGSEAAGQAFGSGSRHLVTVAIGMAATDARTAYA
jgi:hypothetical protein